MKPSFVSSNPSFLSDPLLDETDPDPSKQPVPSKMTMATHFTDILDPEYGPSIRVFSPDPDPSLKTKLGSPDPNPSASN